MHRVQRLTTARTKFHPDTSVGLPVGVGTVPVGTGVVGPGGVVGVDVGVSVGVVAPPGRH